MAANGMSFCSPPSSWTQGDLFNRHNLFFPRFVSPPSPHYQTHAISPFPTNESSKADVNNLAVFRDSYPPCPRLIARYPPPPFTTLEILPWFLPPTLHLCFLPPPPFCAGCAVYFTDSLEGVDSGRRTGGCLASTPSASPLFLLFNINRLTH